MGPFRVYEALNGYGALQGVWGPLEYKFFQVCSKTLALIWKTETVKFLRFLFFFSDNIMADVGPFRVYRALQGVWGPLGCMGPFRVYGAL